MRGYLGSIKVNRKTHLPLGQNNNESKKSVYENKN